MEPAGGEPGAQLSAEAAALKRNTDCVYFLASPLTCKKGTECEYRHSEVARFNTRDCWYWFNGNCLNPMCSFRHPPIDGLFEVPGTTSASGHIPLDSAASLTSTTVPAYAGSYDTNKQNVPCYYFQKGLCVKGGRCPFMHGPQSTCNDDLHQLPIATGSLSDQPSSNVKGIPNGNVSELKVANAPFDKEAEILPPNAEEPTFQAKGKPNSNCSPVDRPAYQHHEEFVGFESNNVPVESANGHALAVSWTSHSLDEFQNGRDSDEFPGESSPGFDVLVDDQLEADYFQNEDEYVRSPANGICFINDFEYQHLEYEAVRLDRDQYTEIREYERYGSIHHEQHMASRRSLERPRLYERRISRGERSYNNKMGRSDLRHCLSKKRRIDGRRSDHIHWGSDINLDRSHRKRFSHKDDQCFPKESFLSSRLRGRIKVPASCSPDRHANSRHEMDKDWQRNRHRCPVGRINHQVEHIGRFKRRLNEHSRSGVEKSTRHTVSRGDSDSLNFAGPKSLAELRSSKISSKPGNDHDDPKSEDPHSFQAPKSLSVILKRKREITSSIGSDSSSRDREVFESRSGYSSLAEKGELIPGEDADFRYSSAKQNDYESEDGILHTIDDLELETCARKSGNFDSEEDHFQAAYIDNDEDEEEDDFAQKVGVMLS